MRLSKLIVYRRLMTDEILKEMEFLAEHYGDGSLHEELAEKMNDMVFRLIDEAGRNGFYGNLWHCHIAHLLVNDENVYSMASEIGGNAVGTVQEAVLRDFEVLRDLFFFDFSVMQEDVRCAGLYLALNFEGNQEKSHVYNMRIRDRICELSSHLETTGSAAEMKDLVTAFYHAFGVGRFGLHKSFRVAEGASGETIITPILNISHVYLEDLIGYESQKKMLTDNTEAFLSGRPANNVLLYGDAGTGKSSAIKGIINRYYEDGLRIIEIYKHQFKNLNDVIAQIKDRNYKFILYMDDLSFEDFETDYKYLKAVIEGGLEKKPSNILIYATSNRRHLIRETTRDREEYKEDMHRNDTVQEKISLSARFGISIYFPAPQKTEYDGIVLGLAERYGIRMPEDELLLKAGQWELGHAGRSGRVARQFIDHLLGKES